MTLVSGKKPKGQSLVEFAIMLPILLLLILGVFDLGRVIYYYSAIANAAREGARFGVVLEPGSASEASVEGFTLSRAIGVDPVVNATYTIRTEIAGSEVNEIQIIVVDTSYQFIPATPLIGVLFEPSGFITVNASSVMDLER